MHTCFQSSISQQEVPSRRRPSSIQSNCPKWPTCIFLHDRSPASMKPCTQLLAKLYGDQRAHISQMTTRLLLRDNTKYRRRWNQNRNWGWEAQSCRDWPDDEHPAKAVQVPFNHLDTSAGFKTGAWRRLARFRKRITIWVIVTNAVAAVYYDPAGQERWSTTKLKKHCKRRVVGELERRTLHTFPPTTKAQRIKETPPSASTTKSSTLCQGIGATPMWMCIRYLKSTLCDQ